MLQCMGHLDLEYMVWIYSLKTDDAEKTVQLIKEINNQENEENF